MALPDLGPGASSHRALLGRVGTGPLFPRARDKDAPVSYQAGGWASLEALKAAYQQRDDETMLRVVMHETEPREAR